MMGDMAPMVAMKVSPAVRSGAYQDAHDRQQGQLADGEEDGADIGGLSSRKPTMLRASAARVAVVMTSPS
jgi:hypothetical protein